MLPKNVVNNKIFLKQYLKKDIFYETNAELHENMSDDVLL